MLNSQTLCFEWLRSKKEDVKPSTYDKYEMIINNYLISFFDHNSLEQLNINIIKEYLMKLLNKGLSSSVVKTIKNVLKAIYTTYENQYGFNHIDFSLVKIEQEKKENYASNPYFMSISEFEKQMKYLADNNYQCLSMEDVEAYYHGKKEVSKKAVCLTFDDGYKNFNTIVKPIIKKYNLQATNFVIGYKTKTNNPLYLQTNDLKNDQYVEYYSHSYDMHHIGHLPYKKKIETMTTNEIKRDFEKNKGLVSTDYFAFPYGVSCQNAQDYLKSSSVKLAFSYNQNRHMTRNDKQYLLPRYLMFSNMPFPLFKWWIE